MSLAQNDSSLQPHIDNSSPLELASRVEWKKWVAELIPRSAGANQGPVIQAPEAIPRSAQANNAIRTQES